MISYTLCDVPITKEHALKLAESCYKIYRDFPTGNYAQDQKDIQEKLDIVNEIKQDILEGNKNHENN